MPAPSSIVSTFRPYSRGVRRSSTLKMSGIRSGLTTYSQYCSEFIPNRYPGVFRSSGVRFQTATEDE